MPTTFAPDAAQLRQALLKKLEIEYSGVDHQDHGIRFGHQERGLGHARDGWAIEDDGSVRLAERAQESRDVGRRYVGGVPKRHPRRDQFQARVARHSQQVGRAVGDGDVTHAGGEIDPEDLVELRLAQITVDRDDEVPRRGERPRRVCDDARLTFSGPAGSERDHGMRVLEQDVQITAELLERLETPLVPHERKHVGRIGVCIDEHGHLAEDGKAQPLGDLVGRHESPQRPRSQGREGPEMSPSATAATATVPRGFVGVVGSAAVPNGDSTSTEPASRLVTFTTRAAAALA